jgi:quinol monooxygenase YgiN
MNWKEERMIYMMAKYKVREGSEAVVKAAAGEFVETIRLRATGLPEFAVYCDKDGLIFYHIMTFEDDSAAVLHRDASHTEKFWETVLPHCEEIQQLSELQLIASL